MAELKSVSHKTNKRVYYKIKNKYTDRTKKYMYMYMYIYV